MSKNILEIGTILCYQDIDIDKLDNDLLDIREKSDTLRDKLSINLLAKNISMIGLEQPLVVTRKSNESDRYSIIAGRRRFEAVKQLNWKKVPCQIRYIKDKADAFALTTSENIHRVNYNIDEKIEANLSHFTVRGFSLKNIIYLSKKIHNFGSKDIPVRFLDAIELCDYSPNTIYQIAQTKVFIPKDIQKLIKKTHLSLQKRIMLTNSRLRKHPELLKVLVKEIVGLPEKTARIKVRQTIRDLETKAIVKEGKAYVFNFGKREKVDERILKEKTAVQTFMELSERIHEIMHLLTGHRLSQKDQKYEPIHIDTTEKHRSEITRELTPNEVIILEDDLDVLGEAISSMLDILQKEGARKND